MALSTFYKSVKIESSGDGWRLINIKGYVNDNGWYTSLRDAKLAIDYLNLPEELINKRKERGAHCVICPYCRDIFAFEERLLVDRYYIQCPNHQCNKKIVKAPAFYR